MKRACRAQSRENLSRQFCRSVGVRQMSLTAFHSAQGLGCKTASVPANSSLFFTRLCEKDSRAAMPIHQRSQPFVTSDCSAKGLD